MNRKLVNFQVFPDLAHQAELEIHQGQIRLDRNFPFHGTHVRSTYDVHDKHWIPYIGINDPSNCKADTKNKGYKKLLKTFTAPRANDYSIEYYDHNIIRSNQYQFLDDDNFPNLQSTIKFFIKSSYTFTLNILDKKHDHNISEALSDFQAYEPFHEKSQTISITFHFLTPKKRDLHCSHDIMLRTKQTHTYNYYRFIQNHFHLHTPSRQPHHRFQFINSKYSSPFFLNFT